MEITVKVINESGKFLKNGGRYTLQFEGPKATVKEMEVELFINGFSSPADGKKRFIRPIDPLFFMNDSREFEIKAELIQA